MKKQTGIWLDLRNAWVINLPIDQNEEVTMHHIASDIQEGHAVGGTRSKTPWGPQGFSDQHSMEEKRHRGEKHFFADILKHMDIATEEVVIFGPSEAKYGLENMLTSQPHTPVIKGVEAADQMTEHQMKAWVLKFFGHLPPRKMAEVGREHK